MSGQTAQQQQQQRNEAAKGGNDPGEDDADDDEVYQYPKAGLGPVFASLETLLRCAICRGLSDPPVSLPCCQQTFCSLCIRQYLDSSKPRCPCCRKEAASNQLLMCKELRSICQIWKRNRRAILAAANKSSTAAAAASGTTAAAAAADPNPPTSGRRQICALGAGQGRSGGTKLKKLFYHQLTEAKMRLALKEVGLPIGGGKAAMVERHKRLALLEAASRDREVPVSRRELIRQVASWEGAKEKDKRESAARAATGGILSATASTSLASTVSISASSRGTAGQAARRGGMAGEGGGSTQAAPDKIVIPKDMQAGFSALIANARKKAKKRPCASGANGGSGNDNGSCVKKARISEDTAGMGRGDDVAAMIGSDSASSHDPCTSGRDIRHSATSGVIEAPPVPDAGGATEMRILGVAGRMVRTRGPWRCVFSNGAPPPSAPLSPPPPSSTVERHSNDPAAEDAAANNGPAGAAGAAGVSTTIAGAAKGSSEDGKDGGQTRPTEGETVGGHCPPATAVEGNDGTGDAGPAVGGSRKRTVQDRELAGVATTGTDSRAGRVRDLGEKADTLPAGAVKEEGLLYLNTATGETSREPPLELVARAEEADNAGDYLVFVPSRSFLAAASCRSTVAAACTNGNGEAKANADPTAIDRATARAKGKSVGGNTAIVVSEPSSARLEGRVSVQPLLEAPTPHPVAAATAAASIGHESANGGCRASGGSGSRGDGDGGGSGETWSRLSSVSMIDLSQGEASTPLDKVGTEGVSGGEDGDGDAREKEVDPAGGGGRRRGGSVADGAGAATDSMWSCGACTLLNRSRRASCAVCASPRPEGFGSPQGLASRGRDDGTGGVSAGKAGSGKLRLLQRRSGGSVPQSSMRSFTTRPLPRGTSDRGKGIEKDAGRGSREVWSSATTTATVGAAAGGGSVSHPSSSAQEASPAAAVATPAHGVPMNLSREDSPPAAAATSTAAAAAEQIQ